MAITAIPDSRGKFRQGSTTDLLIKITELDGRPRDPSVIEVTIRGPEESPSDLGPIIVDDSEPFKVSNGYYVFSWEIPIDQTIGTYNVTWTYTVDGEDRIALQSLVVVQSEDNTLPSAFYSERIIMIREALAQHVHEAMNIPVFYEQAKPSRDNTNYYFSFNKWNQSSPINIYRNNQIVDTGATIDYFNGKITFDNQLMDADVIQTDYNFSWFSEDDLNRCLGNATQIINTYPPASNFVIETVPDRFIPVLFYSASACLLRMLMFSLQFQQPQQIFGGAEESQRAFSNFESLKKNYEDDTTTLLEQKKYGPLPKMTMLITPEYTLPGGRSRWFRMLFK